MNKKDILIILLLVLIAVIAGVLYANPEKRNQLKLALYPLHAQAAAMQMDCSVDAPAWLSQTLRYVTKEQHTPANQIAYITPQGKLSHCSNGYKDIPFLSDKINSQTRFRFASVTKLWTSDAILDLVRTRQLSLHDHLYDFFPEFSEPTDRRIKDITIGDLLLHRAGFDRNSILGQNMILDGKNSICPYHFKALEQIKLGFAPGEKMSYSNLGYCFLGEILSRVAHQPYTDYISSHYQFDKTSIRFLDEQKFSDEPKYYYIETGITGFSDIYGAYDFYGLASAAGLSGNAVDLAKQVKMMIGKPKPNILSGNSSIDCDLSKMFDCYGYAMFAYKEQDHALEVYFRDGSLLGISSLVVVDSYGGVTALLSSGSYLNHVSVKKYMYQVLDKFYRTHKAKLIYTIHG